MIETLVSIFVGFISVFTVLGLCYCTGRILVFVSSKTIKYPMDHVFIFLLGLVINAFLGLFFVLGHTIVYGPLQ